MTDNVTRTILGSALLVVGTLVMLSVGSMDASVPAPLAGLATLVIAAGTIAVGLSGENAGV